MTIRDRYIQTCTCGNEAHFQGYCKRCWDIGRQGFSDSTARPVISTVTDYYRDSYSPETMERIRMLERGELDLTPIRVDPKISNNAIRGHIAAKNRKKK